MSNNHHLTTLRTGCSLSPTCTGDSLPSSITSTGHTLSKTDGAKVTCRQCPLDCHSRCTSAHSWQPRFLCPMVGWRALRASAPQQWVLHAARRRETTVIHCPRERGEERKKCQGPSRKTICQLLKPHCSPHGLSRGMFPVGQALTFHTIYTPVITSTSLFIAFRAFLHNYKLLSLQNIKGNNLKIWLNILFSEEPQVPLSLSLIQSEASG